LGNFVKRFLILGDEELAMQEMQAGGGATAGGPSGMSATASEGGLKGLVRGVKDEAEIEAITKALEQTNWNRKKAAALLKISYKALLYKIRQYEIQRTGSYVQ
jgi:DNA-binding NtrC family response regulator